MTRPTRWLTREERDTLEELYPAPEPFGADADELRRRIRALERELRAARDALRACERLPSRHDAVEREQVAEARRRGRG